MILFQDPTRWKHFVLAIPIGLVFTILCVLGVATGMEFKDRQWGGLWDWKDWLCTMIGGVVGQLLQIILIYLLSLALHNAGRSRWSTASDHPHLFVKSIE